MAHSQASGLDDRPLMIFDGDCGVCRAAVDRWREATGSQIRYAPYQEVAANFPQIDIREFRRAVHLINPDGTVSRGAAAVLHAMALCGRKRWLGWLYKSLPPFAFAAEAAYRLYAANRKPIAIVRRIWFGKDLKLPTYHIASALFLRLLGVVYLIAFVSLWTQINGLVGDHGILPLANYLDAVDQHFSQATPPASPVWNLPTLAWISPHDGFLNFLCGAGTILSVMLIAGLLPLPTLVLLWGIYLSLVHAGQDFLSFQWDILLLETGFAAIFLAPFSWRSQFLADRHPPRLAIWLLWWILFRLMLESGAVKLTWNTWDIGPDGLPAPNTWKSLTALDFHYWTQPLPMWTSWYAAKLPQWFQKLSVVFVLVSRTGHAVAHLRPANSEVHRLRRDHAADDPDRRHGQLQLLQSAHHRPVHHAIGRQSLAAISAAANSWNRLAGVGLSHALANRAARSVCCAGTAVRHAASERSRRAGATSRIFVGGRSAHRAILPAE